MTTARQIARNDSRRSQDEAIEKSHAKLNCTAARTWFSERKRLPGGRTPAYRTAPTAGYKREGDERQEVQLGRWCRHLICNRRGTADLHMKPRPASPGRYVGGSRFGCRGIASRDRGASVLPDHRKDRAYSVDSPGNMRALWDNPLKDDWYAGANSLPLSARQVAGRNWGTGP